MAALQEVQKKFDAILRLQSQFTELLKRIGNGSVDPVAARRALQRILEEKPRTASPTSVTLLIGTPGSGKTHFVASMVANGDFCRGDTVIVCPDAIREELTGDASDQSVNREAWDLAYARIHQALEAGFDVVVDATNARQLDRVKLIVHCRLKADRVLGLWFVAPPSTCRKRNLARSRVVPENAMHLMEQLLLENPPTESEGFDQLTMINNS